MQDVMLLPAAERQELWRRLVEAIEGCLRGAGEARVTPEMPAAGAAELRQLLASWDFAAPVAPAAALEFAVGGLSRLQVQTTSPRYFGLFNPASTTMGIAADALVAAFNPQLATWNHSPFAVAVEEHLVRAFAARLGYDPAKAEGCLTSGGAEANHMALAVALQRAFPEVGRRGLLALRNQPLIYVSSQAHHSIVKAARLAGLGTDAVRELSVDGGLRMRPRELAARIADDRADGHAPFLVVATAGSTTAGIIDPIALLAEVADREGLWLHVDAAWGGAAALVPELRPALAGIERASSITFDAHKWLSVPMGAGLFLSRHPGILERTFRVAASYMPATSGQPAVADPYAHTMQWSRRFIGLKLFLSLAVAGWEGYEEVLRHQVAMGRHLRQVLTGSGWLVVNDTPLPLVCFTRREGATAAQLEAVAAAVTAAGAAWISAVQLGSGTALRACITNYRTGPADLDALAEALGRAWESLEG